MLIDSHCHLDHLDLNLHGGSIENVLSKARLQGVERFLSVGVNLGLSRKLIALSEKHSDVVVSVGVHPLQDELPELPSVDELVELGKHPRVVAIGETGLDNYYSSDNATWQQESFKRHLRAAEICQKPVIVHTREAKQQTLDILDKYVDKSIAGVLHCFTETLEMALTAVEMNFYISFSGIITFKNAAPLREVVKHIPLERILVETDCPWLAPTPYRGKQNQPAYVVEVAKAVASIKDIAVDDVIKQTTNNFIALFGNPDKLEESAL